MTCVWQVVASVQGVGVGEGATWRLVGFVSLVRTGDGLMLTYGTGRPLATPAPAYSGLTTAYAGLGSLACVVRARLVLAISAPLLSCFSLHQERSSR